MQRTTESGSPTWEVVSCLNCDWPKKDNRPVKGVDVEHLPPGQVKKLIDTPGSRLREFPK